MSLTPPEPDADDDVLEGLGAFVKSVVVPLEQRHEAVLDDPAWTYGSSGAYSSALQELMREVRTKAAQAGYYTMLAPRSIGGGGLTASSSLKAWEYLYRVCGPARLLPYEVMAHWASGPSFLYEFLSDEVRREVLPEILDGTSTTCFCMSEPDAGSDAWAMRTRAELDGDEWILSGTKQWITNGPSAQYAFVFAVTDPDLQRQRRGGITCFLVPTNSRGFTVDSVIRLFGSPGGNEAILSFQDVRLRASQIVGQINSGFDLALRGVMDGRMYNAGRSLGLARWALEKATEYAKVRRTFGNPISSYQGISFMLAESAMEIYATRCMALDCSRRLDQGELPQRDMSILKAFSTEMCFQVLDRCMQIHGGMGLTNEMKLYDGWHQARIIRIADGSAEIMRRNIASRLLHGDTTF